MKQFRAILIACILAVGWLLPTCAQAQALKADYQFRNTLASSVGTAPPLENLGENTFGTETVNGQPRPVLRFPQGSGVVIPRAKGVIPADTYSLVILFRFVTTDGWRRLVDFKNATFDMGLYTKDGRLQFYNDAIGDEVVVQPGVFVQVMLTRDRQKNVCGYVNGRLQFTFVDAADQAVIGDANNLRFFRDDGDEHSAGAAARIRLYDGPLAVARLDPPTTRFTVRTAHHPSSRYSITQLPHYPTTPFQPARTETPVHQPGPQSPC